MFYEILPAHDVSVIETNIVTLPNTRIKRTLVESPLIISNITNIPIRSTNSNTTTAATITSSTSTATAATSHQQNSSVQTNIDKYNGTKTIKEGRLMNYNINNEVIKD